MNPETALPPIQPHTQAKHDILRRHLSAWFPILGRANSQLAYVDGFAGPGAYAGGEPGSPIIALDTLQGHDHLPEFTEQGKRIDFLFVERDSTYFQALEKRIGAGEWPRSFHVRCRHGEFEPVFRNFLQEMGRRNRTVPPILLFIDPFGPSGFSMELLGQIAQYPRVDVLINYNYVDQVHWALADESKHGMLNRLYGSGRWWPAKQMQEPQRKDFLLSEYAQALEEVGRRTTSFEMVNRQNQTQYYLFFAATHPRGTSVIKDAMRRVSPDEAFRYSDRSNPSQPMLFGMGMDRPYAEELSSSLSESYHGRTVSKETIVAEKLDFHPRWIEKDLTAALRILEDSVPPRIIDVSKPDGSRRRKGSYPQGCLITFSN